MLPLTKIFMVVVKWSCNTFSMWSTYLKISVNVKTLQALMWAYAKYVNLEGFAETDTIIRLKVLNLCALLVFLSDESLATCSYTDLKDA